MTETSLVNCFLDSNAWLYAFIESQDQQKSVIARRLVHDNVFIISAQVINEVCINLIKKANFDEAGIRRLVVSFYLEHYVVEITKEILLKASELRSRYRFSFWDSIIVSSALNAEATILYSEDMGDGLVVDDRLTIRNPFGPSA